MRVHEEFPITGSNEVVSIPFFNGGNRESADRESVDIESVDPSALQKIFRFAVNGVVKTREVVLKFGGFAIPLIIAYNAGKVMLVTELGEPVMDFFNVAEDTQKHVMESSIPIILGTSKTLYAGVLITAEKIREVLKERGGASVVLNKFLTDEKS